MLMRKAARRARRADARALTRHATLRYDADIAAACAATTLHTMLRVAFVAAASVVAAAYTRGYALLLLR